MKKAKAKKEKIKIKEEEESGTDLDDAFADDEDVEYGESKPFKAKKKKDEGDEEGMSADELEEELDEIEEAAGGDVERGDIQIKASKPVAKIKKGDKIKVDGREYEVDSHYVLIDHGTTKEMAIEIFSGDKDYQVRYFNDQFESTIDFYELQGEIMFVKKPFKKIEW